MKSIKSWLTMAVVAAVISALGAAAAWAIPLAETAIYIEINATDGDAGIQIFLDGEGWDSMQVKDPYSRVVLNVAAEGGVALQGITELFLESAEPSFEEQPLEDFLALFPEGLYGFRGTTTDGRPLRGTARLTHRIPDAPEILSPEEEEEVDVDDVIVEWERVPNPPGSRIVAYEVIVEKDEGRLRVFKADMAGYQTSVSVPAEFLEPGTAYKAEVLAIERSGNRTISEVEFETAGGGGGDDD